MFQKNILASARKVGFGGLCVVLVSGLAACDQGAADPLSPQVEAPAGPISPSERPSLLFTTLGVSATGLQSAAFGRHTTASGSASMAMGTSSRATGVISTAMGSNTLASGEASIAMGTLSTASAAHAFVQGYQSTASGIDAVAMGRAAIASGNNSFALGLSATASGSNSRALGQSVTASGNHTTALGYNASTNNHQGSFVFGDVSNLTLSTPVTPTAANQFVVRAAGGTTFFSNAAMNAGVRLASGSGSWSSLSDAGMKENFRELDGETVLESIARMSIREWNYISQDAAIRHVGPTAQDFHAAFGLGEDPTRISTVDAAGIALLAIQALERRTAELERTVQVQDEQIRLLSERLSAVERELQEN